MRAGGSYFRGTNGHSNGLVPMLRNFNETARYVDQGGGKRKGSFAMYLEPWHADVWAHKQTFSRCACFLYKLILVCCLALVVGAVRGTADACATMALMSSLGFASILYVICFLRKWACSVRGTGRGGRADPVSREARHRTSGSTSALSPPQGCSCKAALQRDWHRG